jgi:hypothetical protein
MTLQEAKSIVRHLGLTLRKVPGNEAAAYYTNDLENAVNAAVEMARSSAVGTYEQMFGAN